jgi:hypothetical protein
MKPTEQNKKVWILCIANITKVMQQRVVRGSFSFGSFDVLIEISKFPGFL